MLRQRVNEYNEQLKQTYYDNMKRYIEHKLFDKSHQKTLLNGSGQGRDKFLVTYLSQLKVKNSFWSGQVILWHLTYPELEANVKQILIEIEPRWIENYPDTYLIYEANGLYISIK